MQIQHILKHLFFLDWQIRRAFPQSTLDAIESAIHSAEQIHGGEIRFVVEGGLEGRPLWLGQSTRERAIDVFSQLRIWDTEDNCGVLIYVQLADRSVEIIADRGIHARTGSECWNIICREMEISFSKSDFQVGALAGIRATAGVIGRHFPPQNKRVNELSDAPVILL